MTGRALIDPSATTARPLSSSLRKSTSSISSPIRIDLRAAAADQVGLVRAGEEGALQQREQPCERGAQLVRDGGGEPGAQLLIGGQVARCAEVEERLAAAAERRTGISCGVRPPACSSSSGSTEPSTRPSRDSRARRLAATTRRSSSSTTTISLLSSIRIARALEIAAHRLGRRRGRGDGESASPDCHQIVTGL